MKKSKWKTISAKDLIKGKIKVEGVKIKNPFKEIKEKVFYIDLTDTEFKSIKEFHPVSKKGLTMHSTCENKVLLKMIMMKNAKIYKITIKEIKR